MAEAVAAPLVLQARDLSLDRLKVAGSAHRRDANSNVACAPLPAGDGCRLIRGGFPPNVTGLL